MIVGIGVDIVKVARFQKWIDNPKLTSRFFHEKELTVLNRPKNSALQSLAVRFAAKEAIGNVLQHASAKRVLILLVYSEKRIELNIEDNGKGFDIKKALEESNNNNLHGFGLSTMRERAKLLKGVFSIDSIVGKGTKVHVSVPANYVGGNQDETNKNSNRR